ncbi:BT4734/BF3469 family protein [Aliivibrio sp. EL58]|uniref:BT4734/BF3469 family protein n=1 Tax=Aliivibrio sp. EL58 TaxID=2107582 RepID=UPI000EFC7B69|nr:BT4734/BF3469 family protein [Aliivibrio sp. EL58]
MEINQNNIAVISDKKVNGQKVIAGDISLKDLISKTKDGTYKQLVLAYQAAKKTDAQAKKEDYVPSVMPHAFISDGIVKLKDDKDQYQHERWDLSGIIHLDLDKIDIDINEVKAKLLTTKPIALFTSPSGNGLKCFWAHDLESTLANKKNFQRIAQHHIRQLLSDLGLGKYYDGKVYNPNRQCYVSYDENAYHSEANKALTLSKTATWYLSKLAEVKALEDRMQAIKATATGTVSQTPNQSRIDYIIDKNAANANAISNSGYNGAFSLATVMIRCGMDDISIENKLAITFPSTKNWGGATYKDQIQAARNLVKDSRFDFAESIKLVLSNEDETALKQFKSDLAQLQDELNTNKPIKAKRQPLGTIDVVSGLPSTGKTYEAIKRITDAQRGIFVYAVHDINTMGWHDGSRVKEIENYCTENDITCPDIVRIASSDQDGNKLDGIMKQAQDAVSNLSDYSVIFITHKGLEYLDFGIFQDLSDGGTHLIVDEVPSIFELRSESASLGNYNTLLSYLEYKQEDDHIVASSLSDKGFDLLAAESDRNNDWYITKLRELTKLNIQSRFIYNKENCNLKTLSIIDIEKLLQFNSLTLMGDDAHNSILCLLLKDRVDINVRRLTPRHDKIAHRFNGIYYCTNLTYGTAKVNRHPEILQELSKDIFKVGVIDHDIEQHLCLFNKQELEVDTFGTSYQNMFGADGLYTLRGTTKDDDAGSKNLVYGTANTHGKNNLQSFELVACLYSLKPSPIQNAYLLDRGLTQEQIYRWTEYNSHMQNAFRGWLRDPNSNSKGVLVLPDIASFNYFVDRIREEFGDSEADSIKAMGKCIDNPIVEDLFMPKKSGRKTKTGDEALTATQRSKLRKWRNHKDLSPQFVDDKFASLGVAMFEMKLPTLKQEYGTYKPPKSNAERQRRKCEKVKQQATEADGFDALKKQFGYDEDKPFVYGGKPL